MSAPPHSDRDPDRSGRRRLAMLAATAGGVLAAGIVLAVSLALLGPPGRGGNSAAPAVPTATASYTTPPAVEVKQIHDTLDDIAARCTPNADPDAQRHLDQDVDVILAFAGRHPNAEFPMDDETGHTLSLLLATRDDLSHCAPAAAARVNAALPAQFRQPPSPTG